MMKTNINFLALTIGLFVWSIGSATAQKSIKEYVEKTSKEKINKNIVMGPGLQPVTARGFGDGHGKNPLLLSTGQLPDTVALITLYIYDLGTTSIQKSGNWVNTSYSAVSAEGGNVIANEIYKNTIAELKTALKHQGVVLLTPEEFLNTAEKRNYYNNNFKTNLTKLGNFVSNIEMKHVDIAVGADNYRVFDLAAAPDPLRSESLGGDLAKKLGVKGVLSIAVEIQSNKKFANMHGIRMSLHGPNPIPKENKKYVAQNLGNGYYNGQLYAYGTFFFKKPVHVISFEKKQLAKQNFEGLGTIFGCFADKFYQVMNESIQIASKKY